MVQRLTGLEKHHVTQRLNTSPAATVAEAFEQEWPVSAERLRQVRVDLARRAHLDAAIAAATRLDVATVRSRLGAAPDGGLGDLFPELAAAAFRRRTAPDVSAAEILQQNAPSPEGPRAVASEPDSSGSTIQPQPLQKGQLVGHRWRVVGPLGEGGFSTAYAVEEEGSGQPRVLKVATRQEHRVRLKDEYLLATRLRHSNICGYLLLEQQPEVGLYAVLHHGGLSLDNHLRAPWAPAEAVEMVRQIAAGLDHAHAKHVLHLDVKPANILRSTGDGAPEYCITDFGISIRGEVGPRADGGITLSGSEFHGLSPPYAAPEQRERLSRQASDQFSLARVFLAVVLGRELEDDEQAPSVIPGLGSSQNAAIQRALSVDPEKRFASCTEFAHALRPRGPLQRASHPDPRLHVIEQAIIRVQHYLSPARSPEASETTRRGQLVELNNAMEGLYKAVLQHVATARGTTAEDLWKLKHGDSSFGMAGAHKVFTLLRGLDEGPGMNDPYVRLFLADLRRPKDQVPFWVNALRNRAVHTNSTLPALDRGLAALDSLLDLQLSEASRAREGRTP